jgi:adenine-specific DNA-methyltransferase
MTDLNDLLVTSPDHRSERLKTLKGLFPDLFTAEGKLNPVELKYLLEDDETKSDKEQYAFTWRGKGRAKKHAFTPSRAALTYDPERSVNPGKANGNVIIEGENLEVLKLLTSAYREQVKCIYIDPPYNTGGDFVYPDNYTQHQKEYWEESGSYQDGVKLDTNPETSGRYHSDWLSMMYSRLLVARQLLKDDGVIFVSIDDHEIHNLRRLMDEVFGEENFVDCIIWKKRYGGGAKEKHLVSLHEYVLFYAKDIENLDNIYIPLDDESIKRYYKYKDENFELRGPYRTHPLEATKSMGDRRNLVYPIPAPDGSEVMPKRQWLWSKERTFVALENQEIEFIKGNGAEWTVHSKQYLMDESGEIRKSKAFSIIDNVYSQHGTNEVIELFGDARIFPFPKPINFMRFLIEIAFESPDGIILDFFAGSGSTAHTIMRMNQEDGGHRKYILVQLPEAIDSSLSAYKAGYRTISQITIERNKRVIQGYGNDPQPLDAGFKVYRLTKSHFPRAEFQSDPDKSNDENVQLLKQYIAEKEASFHMAFEQDRIFDEVLLKHGFKLDYNLTKQGEFGKNAVYLAEEDDRKAYICLDTTIASETIDFFKTHKNTMFICLERALDTTKKWNLNHTLGERLKAL